MTTREDRPGMDNVPREARVTEHGTSTTKPVKPEAEATMLVAGMLAAPVAWLLHLVVSYALVGVTCRTGSAWLHHGATALAVAIALPGGVAAWKEWQRTPKDEESAPRARHRTHFLAISGIVNSVFFSSIIILSWAAAFFVSPCIGKP